MGHVIKTMDDTLPDDPWHTYFKAPAVVQALIAKGALGQKSGAGFFRKVGKDILVLDPAHLDQGRADYVPQTGKVSDEVASILKLKSPAEKFAKLRAVAIPGAVPGGHPSRSFHYAAFHLADIAATARDIDFAMRWGLRLAAGPVRNGGPPAGPGCQWINSIAAGKTMKQPLCPLGLRSGAHRRVQRRVVFARRTNTCRVDAPVTNASCSRRPCLAHRSTKARRSSRPTMRVFGISPATTSRSCRSRPRCIPSAPA
jgi:3-hydroxyacyl-CoA dehydrogenase